MNKTLKEILTEIRNWRYLPLVLAYALIVGGLTFCADPGYTLLLFKIANGICMILGGIGTAVRFATED